MLSTCGAKTFPVGLDDPVTVNGLVGLKILLDLGRKEKPIIRTSVVA